MHDTFIYNIKYAIDEFIFRVSFKNLKKKSSNSVLMDGWICFDFFNKYCFIIDLFLHNKDNF